jgi:hypothetical protein
VFRTSVRVDRLPKCGSYSAATVYSSEPDFAATREQSVDDEASVVSSITQ